MHLELFTFVYSNSLFKGSGGDLGVYCVFLSSRPPPAPRNTPMWFNFEVVNKEESVALTEAVKRLEELDTTYGSTFNSALTNLDRLQQFVQASGDNTRQDALIKINMELDETVSRVKQEKEEINRWIEMKREDFNQRRNELLTQLRDVSKEISANKNEMY